MTYNNDAYYDVQDYDDRTDEIEERTWELMKVGGRWDYRTTSAVAEALSEMGVDDDKALQDAINSGNYEQIGRKVMMMALDYYEKFAKDTAENEIND
jgi:hypothetical protein